MTDGGSHPMTGGHSHSMTMAAVPVEPLTELLARGTGDRPALIVPDNGEVLTYAQLAARIEALARQLAGLRVMRGDRLALSLPNGPDFALLLLAITVLVRSQAPLNPRVTATDS